MNELLRCESNDRKCVCYIWWRMRFFFFRGIEERKRERRETVGCWLEESCWVVLCSICLLLPIWIFLHWSTDETTNEKSFLFSYVRWGKYRLPWRFSIDPLLSTFTSELFDPMTSFTFFPMISSSRLIQIDQSKKLNKKRVSLISLFHSLTQFIFSSLSLDTYEYNQFYSRCSKWTNFVFFLFDTLLSIA